MADEITVSTSLSVENGNYSFQRLITGLTFDQSAKGGQGGIQNIGFAADEAIDVGDVTTVGWCIFRNLDDTNFVEVGIEVAATFEPMIRIEPGETALFRLSQDAGATLYAQADTAAVDLEYYLAED